MGHPIYLSSRPHPNKMPVDTTTLDEAFARASAATEPLVLGAGMLTRSRLPGERVIIPAEGKAMLLDLVLLQKEALDKKAAVAEALGALKALEDELSGLTEQAKDVLDMHAKEIAALAGQHDEELAAAGRVLQNLRDTGEAQSEETPTFLRRRRRGRRNMSRR